ncbi:MAG: ABC transporter substrate-binding protein [Acidimicrobiales bacterium]
MTNHILKSLWLRRSAAIAIAIAFVVVTQLPAISSAAPQVGARAKSTDLKSVKLILSWLPQTEFAGFYVAIAKGWYRADGLNVSIVPGGEDVDNPATLMLTGAVNVADTSPAQDYLDLSNGTDLEDVFQYYEGPTNLYIARKSSGIKTLKDMVGKSVGLWFGGDQYEFYAMLKKAGVNPKKVDIFAQGDTIVPWLQGKYDVMAVTPYNELQEVLEHMPLSSLNIFSAVPYGVAILGDNVSVLKSYADSNPATVQAFLDATAEGWSWSIAHPVKAAAIVVKAVPSLTLPFQIKQLHGMIEEICTGPTLKANEGMGYLSPTLLGGTDNTLKEAGALKKPVPVAEGFDARFWKNIPKQYVHPKCP